MNETLARTDTVELGAAVPDTAVCDIDRQSARAPSSSNSIHDVTINEKIFGIRLADTDEGRNSASYLINKMYAWRGYGGTHRIEKKPNRITLSASNKGDVVGTVTLSLDSSIGLLADEVFKDQLDLYRARGAKLCEITKLAFDPSVRSKAALASLFHILYIYAHHLNRCTDVFIEVNPRHRRFYETMLGFRQQCEMRHNPRVDAPAYLLWVSLEEVGRQIQRVGGTSSHPGNERSLFPYFFSPREEEGITRRLLSLE
jgi:hypothetical protein